MNCPVCTLTGDYVLCDHPRLKKGLSRGIAHKYYGPFIIKKVDVNGIDYLIQRAGAKKAKIYKIHQNRLKFYNHSEIKLKEIKEESLSESEDNTNKPKRKYVKNMNNPRWNKEFSSEEESGVSSEHSETGALDHLEEGLEDTNEEESQHQEEEICKKRKYTKNLDNPRWKNKKNNQSDASETFGGIKRHKEKPIIKNPSYHYKTRRSKRIKEKNYNTSDVENGKSMEKNADEQHLKNNCKYNLRSHKKEPDKDQ